MLTKLLEVPALQGLLPFARIGYDETTTLVWEDDERVRHHIKLRAMGSANALGAGNK